MKNRASIIFLVSVLTFQNACSADVNQLKKTTQSFFCCSRKKATLSVDQSVKTAENVANGSVKQKKDEEYDDWVTTLPAECTIS